MFCVFFEVQPREGQSDAYFKIAMGMRKEVESIDGFMHVERFSDAERPDAFLSFSTWRDEKSLIRWRINAKHHVVQAKGRDDIFDGYRIRIGELTGDTDTDAPIAQFRYDETETGAAKTLAFAEHATGAMQPPPLGSVSAKLFHSVTNEGRSATLTGWANAADAASLVDSPPLNTRVRRFRIVRDYTMVERHEAPQYWPEVAAFA